MYILGSRYQNKHNKLHIIKFWEGYKVKAKVVHYIMFLIKGVKLTWKGELSQDCICLSLKEKSTARVFCRFDYHQ